MLSQALPQDQVANPADVLPEHLQQLQKLALELEEGITAYTQAAGPLSPNRQKNIEKLREMLDIPKNHPAEYFMQIADALALSIHNYLYSDAFITGWMNGSSLRTRLCNVIKQNYPIVLATDAKQKEHYVRFLKTSVFFSKNTRELEQQIASLEATVLTAQKMVDQSSSGLEKALALGIAGKPLADELATILKDHQKNIATLKQEIMGLQRKLEDSDKKLKQRTETINQFGKVISGWQRENPDYTDHSTTFFSQPQRHSRSATEMTSLTTPLLTT
jgi:DNA repair exonuclease SbcCD ATPase subunit